MRRPQILIASSSKPVVATLRQVVGLVVPSPSLQHYTSHCHFQCREDLFALLEVKRDLDCIAVVDLTPGPLTNNPWELGFTGQLGLASELVLSYPEVYFVFIVLAARTATQDLMAKCSKHTHEVLSDSANEIWSRIRNHHLIELGTAYCELQTRLSWHANGFRNLFDPTGLRAVLKRTLLLELRDHIEGGTEVAPYLQTIERRLSMAASSIEEEATFLYLNGYSAFKAGLSTWLCPSEAETHRVHCGLSRGEGGVGETRGRHLSRIVTDFELQFPDMGAKTGGHLEILRQALKSAHPGGVVFVTSEPGHANKMTQIYNLLGGGAALDYVAKPYPGLLELVRVIGKDLFEDASSLEGPASLSLTEEFPARPKNRHAGPFAIGRVANRLLLGAREALANGKGVEEWILSALLFSEARDILAGLARTMYFEAIAGQHEAEVAAETAFFGIVGTISAKERLDDLTNSLDPTGNLTDKKAKLNCILQSVGNLRVRYHAQEQFEAAEECLPIIRNVEFRLRAMSFCEELKFSWRSANSAASLLFTWYLNLVTGGGRSIGRLLLAHLTWVLSFFLLYFMFFSSWVWTLNTTRSPETWERLGASLLHSTMMAFTMPIGLDNYFGPMEFTMNPSYFSYLVLSVVEVLISYVHLGILISLLYSKLTREQ